MSGVGWVIAAIGFSTGCILAAIRNLRKKL